jgi:hypothetical protein
MTRVSTVIGAVAAILLAGVPLPAQTSSTPTFLSVVSTGMLGLAGAQTAQVNVVNLAITSNAKPTPCEVQLEFWDSTGKLVKSSTIADLAQGAAGALQLKLGEITTATSSLRSEIRAVVRSNALTPSASGGTASPVFYPLGCSVVTTLEVFDTISGVTQSMTSDVHALASGVLLPVARGMALQQ